jgi:hypothetical protein
MKVDCRVKIQGEDHHVRIEIPADRQREIADRLREFAIRTAYLEHYGYLPRGVINIMDGVPSEAPGVPRKAGDSG